MKKLDEKKEKWFENKGKKGYSVWGVNMMYTGKGENILFGWDGGNSALLYILN